MCIAIETNNIWAGGHEQLRNRIILNSKENQTRAHIVTQQLKSVSNISILMLLLLLFSTPYVTQPGLLVLFYFYVLGCFRVQGCKIRLQGTCPPSGCYEKTGFKEKPQLSLSSCVCVCVNSQSDDRRNKPPGLTQLHLHWAVRHSSAAKHQTWTMLLVFSKGPTHICGKNYPQRSGHNQFGPSLNASERRQMWIFDMWSDRPKTSISELFLSEKLCVSTELWAIGTSGKDSPNLKFIACWSVSV